MNWNRVLMFGMVAWVVTLGGDATASTSAPVRVAVVCDSTNAALVGLVEQVEVRISKQPGVALLDRANIQKVWQEQSRALERGASDQMVLKIGKTLTADILVFVSGLDGRIVWRLMSVADGRLFGLDVQECPSAMREQAVSRAETAILVAVAKVRDAIVAPQYVAVSRFVNEDLSRRQDYLEVVLPELLSSFLSARSSLVLVERAELMKIEEELMRAGGGAAAYRGSTVLVDGVCRERMEGTRRVMSVAVSAGRPGTLAAIRFSCEADSGDWLGLANRIAERLLREMNQPGLGSFVAPSLADEAASFYEKGLFYQRQDALITAIKMYEIAAALLPTNDVYRLREEATRAEGFARRILPPDIMLPHFINEANKYAHAFRDTAESELVAKVKRGSYPDWMKPDVHLSKVSYDSQFGDLKRQASRAYFEAIESMVEWYRNHQVKMPFLLCHSLRGMIKDSGILQDEPSLRRYARLLVELCCSSEDSSDLWDAISFFGWHQGWCEGVPGVKSDAWFDAILEELSHDSRSLVRLYALIALADEYSPRVSDGSRSKERRTRRVDASVRAQEAVNMLALWPGSNNMICAQAYKRLEHVLLGAEPFDARPLVVAIRTGLLETGATYTRPLDVLVRSIPETMKHKRRELEPIAYHEWCDLLVRHLSYAYESGEKSYAEEMARSVMKVSATNGAPQAATCVAAMTGFLRERNLSVFSDMESPAAPVPVSVEPAPVPVCRVLWQTRVEDLVGHAGSMTAAICCGVETGYLFLYGWQFEDAKTNRKKHRIEVHSFDLRSGYFQTNVVRRFVNSVKDFRVASWGDLVWMHVDNMDYIYSQDRGLQTVPQESGIPVDQVTAFASSGDRYFLGCVGGFGEWLPNEQRFKMIASTRVSDERHALSGGSLYRVVGISVDESRNRLVLTVAGGDRDGIWEYSLESGAQRLLHSFVAGYESVAACESDGRYIRVSFRDGAPYAYIYDVKEPDRSLVIGSSTNSYANIRSADPGVRRNVVLGGCRSGWPIAGFDGTFMWPAQGGVCVQSEKMTSASFVRVIDGENKDVLHNYEKEGSIRQLVACRYGFMYCKTDQIGLLPIIDSDPVEWVRAHPLQPVVTKEMKREAYERLCTELNVY